VPRNLEWCTGYWQWPSVLKVRYTWWYYVGVTSTCKDTHVPLQGHFRRIFGERVRTRSGLPVWYWREWRVKWTLGMRTQAHGWTPRLGLTPRAAHRTRSYGFYGRVLRVNTRTVGASSATLNGPACDGVYPSWPVEWRPLRASYGYGYL